MGNNAVLIIFVADIVITTTTKWHLPTSTAQPRKDNIIFLGRQASVNHWTLLTVQAVQEYSFIYLHSLQNILPDSVLRVINILFNCTTGLSGLLISTSSFTSSPVPASTSGLSHYICTSCLSLYTTLSAFTSGLGLYICTSCLSLYTPLSACTFSLGFCIQPQPLHPASASTSILSLYIQPQPLHPASASTSSLSHSL